MPRCQPADIYILSYFPFLDKKKYYKKLLKATNFLHIFSTCFLRFLFRTIFFFSSSSSSDSSMSLRIFIAGAQDWAGNAHVNAAPALTVTLALNQCLGTATQERTRKYVVVAKVSFINKPGFRKIPCENIFVVFRQCA